jgi:sulfonate transport system ATP-binding protein
MAPGASLRMKAAQTNGALPVPQTELDVAITSKTLRTASGVTRPVLFDIAFTLQEGEVCALLGPSGCGKTTLLRIIAGLDQDFDGRVNFPTSHKLAMVFQEPRLLPWRTVFDNLRLAGAVPGKNLDATITALGLENHLGHFPGELSLGLARRVAIARAFAIEPDLLLLDEPFVSLDAALAKRLRAELIVLVERRKATTLIVTHDVEEAVSLADRIIVFSAAPGRIIGDMTIKTPRLALEPACAERIKADILAMMKGSHPPVPGA